MGTCTSSFNYAAQEQRPTHFCTPTQDKRRKQFLVNPRVLHAPFTNFEHNPQYILSIMYLCIYIYTRIYAGFLCTFSMRRWVVPYQGNGIRWLSSVALDRQGSRLCLSVVSMEWRNGSLSQPLNNSPKFCGFHFLSIPPFPTKTSCFSWPLSSEP